jgi:hypothetical protein
MLWFRYSRLKSKRQRKRRLYEGCRLIAMSTIQSVCHRLVPGIIAALIVAGNVMPQFTSSILVLSLPRTWIRRGITIHFKERSPKHCSFILAPSREAQFGDVPRTELIAKNLCQHIPFRFVLFVLMFPVSPRACECIVPAHQSRRDVELLMLTACVLNGPVIQ